MAANTDGLPLLHTFQKHIEDMRNLVQCKICIKPLYEPFILSCGHSYCYSCLTSWFTGGNWEHPRRQNMKCPDCRAAVVQEPSPNYVLRDLVHMFIGRIELLPEDETTHEHEITKTEEAVQMTADRDGVGLFKGAFRNRGPPHQILHARVGRHRAMWDPNDRVERCPECHWELEGGHCDQCDWSISDAEAFSDADEDSNSIVSEFDEDQIFEEDQGGRIRPRSNPVNLLRALGNGGVPFDFDPEFGEDAEDVITISSDVDDVDPVDRELAIIDAGTHSDVDIDMPVAMREPARQYHHEDPNRILEFQGLYEGDFQSTNYDGSEMGDANLQTTSETGDSEDEEESEDDDSSLEDVLDLDTPARVPPRALIEDGDDDDSSVEDVLDQDTPARVPHRALTQNRYDANGNIYISDDDESDDEENTDREPSQAPTTTTNASAVTVDSSSEESSEDESRRTPVPRSRPSRQTRIILDSSEEEENQKNADDDDTNADESDATTNPAQPTAIRQSRLRTQRARRGQNPTRRGSNSPTRRSNAPYSRGGFDNEPGGRRPLQAIPNRHGLGEAYVF